MSKKLIIPFLELAIRIVFRLAENKISDPVKDSETMVFFCIIFEIYLVGHQFIVNSKMRL